MAQDVQTEQGRSGPMDRLKAEAGGLVAALGDRAIATVREKVDGAAGRLTDYVEGGGGPGLMAAVTGARNVAEGKGPVRSMLSAGFKGTTEKLKGLFGGGGGKGGQGKKLKITNIVESIDVGVPVELAYNQWTQFTDFPSFMKKVENVEQVEDPKLSWKAQVFWSHRTWESTILSQVPEDRIIWRSKGDKGYVDGSVTFHELAPNLTRILVVLEYHPQGMFERTGNLWRAQGRRVRLELKHFRRHLMTEGLLHAEDIQGWRGVIEDGEVVQQPEETAEQEPQDEAEDREPQDEYQEPQEGQPEDEYEEAEPEDEYEEAEPEDEYEEAEPEDEYEEAEPEPAAEEAEPEEAEPEDEYEDEGGPDEDRADEDTADEGRAADRAGPPRRRRTARRPAAAAGRGRR